MSIVQSSSNLTSSLFICQAIRPFVASSCSVRTPFFLSFFNSLSVSLSFSLSPSLYSSSFLGILLSFLKKILSFHSYFLFLSVFLIDYYTVKVSSLNLFLFLFLLDPFIFFFFPFFLYLLRTGLSILFALVTTQPILTHHRVF